MEKSKNRKLGQFYPELVSGWKQMVDWCYPLRCPVCDEPVALGRQICQDCAGKLRPVGEVCCYQCGKPLKKEEEEYCHDCAQRAHIFDQGAAMYEYGSVKDSIYRFKYLGRQEYAAYYGKAMADQMKEKLLRWSPDGILPVPISKEREKKRGYNQAALLARKLAEETGIPCYETLVRRCKNTVPMKELSLSARQINLKNAFLISRDDVKLKRVVIIDDIYTTGSTIDALAAVLRENGTQQITFITLAIGTGV